MGLAGEKGGGTPADVSSSDQIENAVHTIGGAVELVRTMIMPPRWARVMSAQAAQPGVYPVSIAELAEVRRRRFTGGQALPTTPKGKADPAFEGGALSSAFLVFESSTNGHSGAVTRPPEGTQRVAANPDWYMLDDPNLRNALSAGERWITVRPNGPGT